MFSTQQLHRFKKIWNVYIQSKKMSKLPPVTPYPTDPDPKEYLHLSEWDKMVKGYPYRPFHKDFVEQRNLCRKLVQEFNQAGSDDERTRRHILDDLFHPSCKAIKSICIEPSFHCDFGINIKVGENFFANFDCVLLDSASIEFGNDCLLAPKCLLCCATHPLNPIYRQRGIGSDMPNYFELTGPIKLGNNCWMGAGTIIVPGVTLGNNVVCGAGTVVTHSFPDNVVLVGNPAQVIRQMPEPPVGAEPFWKNMDGVLGGLLD